MTNFSPDRPPLSQRAREVLPWVRTHPWQSLFLSGVLLLVCSTIGGIITGFTLAPIWDEWAEVAWLKGFYAGHWHIADLWRQHNEHRILLPRLFLLTDWLVFHGTRVFVLVCILIVQTLHARIFIRAARPSLAPDLRPFYTGAVVAFLFSAAQMENFAIPFQVQVVLVFLLASISIGALVLSLQSSAAGERSAARWWFVISLVAAAAGSYSFASGILIWPTLLLLGIALRLPARRIIVLSFTAALVVAAYFRGYHAVPGHQLAWRQPLQVLFYMAGLVSLPLGRIQHELGIAAGLVELAFAAWLFVRLFLDRDKTPAPFFTGVIVFLSSSALATALGRSALGPPEATNNGRYVTWASLFSVCMIAVLLIDQRPFFARYKGKNAAVVTGVLACLLAVVLPAHLDGIRWFEGIGGLARQASQSLIANVCDADLIKPVFPDTPLACESIDFLRAHRLAMFAPEYAREGASLLQSHYHVIRGGQACAGVYENLEVVASPTRPGMRVFGWAWDTLRNRPPERMVFTDARGVISGFATFTRSRPDLARTYPAAQFQNAGWAGYIQGLPATGPYQAYAVLPDHSACLLESLADRNTSFLGIFRNGEWIIDTNKNGVLEPDQDLHFFFGEPGDLPVVGDWDGSGKLKPGVFRNGRWLVDWNGNHRWDPDDRIFDFGLPGDIPVVGDWNHTGVKRLGVFREGLWIFDWNNNHRYDPEDHTIGFGAPGDLPAVGDWDGSGVERIAILRKGDWYLDMNGDFQYGPGDKILSFGLPGDRPTPGDWLGLRHSNLGIFRDGQYYLDWNGNGQWDTGDKIFYIGRPGDLPVVW